MERAKFPHEIMEAIYDKIYLDLEIHILQKKLDKAENEGKENFVTYLKKLIIDVTERRKEVKHFLRKHKVTIQEPVEDTDGEFITYKYYMSINGGYKVSESRFWRHAIRMHLTNRMNKYFKEGM